MPVAAAPAPALNTVSNCHSYVVDVLLRQAMVTGQQINAYQLHAVVPNGQEGPGHMWQS